MMSGRGLRLRLRMLRDARTMSRGPADEHCEQGTLGAEAPVEDGLAERLGEIAVSQVAHVSVADDGGHDARGADSEAHENAGNCEDDLEEMLAARHEKRVALQRGGGPPSATSAGAQALAKVRWRNAPNLLQAASAGGHAKTVPLPVMRTSAVQSTGTGSTSSAAADIRALQAASAPSSPAQSTSVHSAAQSTSAGNTSGPDAAAADQTRQSQAATAQSSGADFGTGTVLWGCFAEKGCGEDCCRPNCDCKCPTARQPGVDMLDIDKLDLNTL